MLVQQKFSINMSLKGDIPVPPSVRELKRGGGQGGGGPGKHGQCEVF